MLLALGPLQLDTTARAVVVGVVAGGDGTDASPATGADVVWLTGPATPERVAGVQRDAGVPVGVTVDDLDLLDQLVAAGAVAIESPSPAAVELAAARRLTLWCTPSQSDRARRAGIPVDRLVCEPAVAGGGVPGATVAGEGPAAWGAVVRDVDGGARVVRTSDVRSVRRVLAVTDRLLAARTGSDEVVRS